MSESTTPAPSTSIEGWAIVEIMGHNRAAGRVKTETFGSVVMLRIDTPDLPEVERPSRFSYGNANEREILPAEAGFTQFVGMASIFRLTPCTEEAARVALDNMRRLAPRRLTPPPAALEDRADELQAVDVDPDPWES